MVGLAAQSSTLSVSAAIEGSPSTVAGRWVRVTADVVAPGVSTDSLVVTVDPKAIGVNKFVKRLTPGGSACLTGGGHHCFNGYVTIDTHAPAGRHTLTVTATDANGRRATATTQVDIARPDDRDGDGLPDAWEERYGLLNPEPGTPAVDGSATGDPDQDGVNNLDEFRANSHPRGRYLRAFTEGSYGERQGLMTCFFSGSRQPPRSACARLAMMDARATRSSTGRSTILASARSETHPRPSPIALWR
jgi:hypothetical protein